MRDQLDAASTRVGRGRYSTRHLAIRRDCYLTHFKSARLHRATLSAQARAPRGRSPQLRPQARHPPHARRPAHLRSVPPRRRAPATRRCRRSAARRHSSKRRPCREEPTVGWLCMPLVGRPVALASSAARWPVETQTAAVRLPPVVRGRQDRGLRRRRWRAWGRRRPRRGAMCRAPGRARWRASPPRWWGARVVAPPRGLGEGARSAGLSPAGGDPRQHSNARPHWVVRPAQAQTSGQRRPSVPSVLHAGSRR